MSDLRKNTGRSPDYRDGYDRAVKDCITWLHERAAKMNDQHATQVLNSAAFSLGVASKGSIHSQPSKEKADE